MITFSIIIPTCNRLDLLKLCLSELYKSTTFLKQDNFEIIVSDDGDDERIMINLTEIFPNVRWVKGPRNGPAANRNNGAKNANGDWLIFFDDDIIPDANILAVYNQAISTYSDIDAFEGSIFPNDWNLLKKDMAECPINISGNCFWTANVCIKRTVFNKVGGFNEKFTIAAQEDQEFYDKLLIYSKIKFIIDAKVIHPVRIENLSKKIANADIAIKNWYKYAGCKYGFWGSLKKGYSSNFFAIKDHIRKGKIKSSFYCSYIIFILLPILLVLQFRKNA